MTSKRIAQTNQQQKNEKPRTSGILQRAAVRSVSEAEVQSTDDLEAQPLGNSAFFKDFSRVPISTTKPQQIMAKQKLSPVMQLMQPHKHDVNRHFHILVGNSSTPSVGIYTGHARGDKYEFRTNAYGTVELTQDKIIGYRPTVGQIHPPNTQTSMEDRLKGRSLLLLSAGDLSEPMARQRRDRNLAQDLAVTTFEEQPKYTSYSENAENLARLGVPILNNVDLSKKENVSRLSNIDTGGQIHFQMPRVPRGTPGYSTQKLVKDTVNIPQTLKRPDINISITTPDPSMYSEIRTHNRLYGLGSERALQNTDMKITETRSDSDLEEYGYTHKQSTTDNSTEVAKKRKKYFFKSGEGEAIQRQEMSEVFSDRINTSWVQKENKTGLPDNLKDGIENLSGMAMDDVRVHYHSPKPAQLQALAYTQGTEIHVGPGQEQHLPHEAWHVVQQKQGRVKPTLQAKGIAINDDQGLEREADVMGSRAARVTGINDNSALGSEADVMAAKAIQQKNAPSQRKGRREGLENKLETVSSMSAVIQYAKYKFQQENLSAGRIQVRIFESDGNRELGQVTVQPVGDVIELHTSAAEGVGGRGVGSDVYRQAISYLFDKKIIPEGATISLSITGGAALNMQVRLLSEEFGDKATFKTAEELRQSRRTANIGNAYGETDTNSLAPNLKKFDFSLIAEHIQQIRSLIVAKKNGKLEDMTMKLMVTPEIIYSTYNELIKTIPENNLEEVITKCFGPKGRDDLAIFSYITNKKVAEDLLAEYSQALLNREETDVNITLSEKMMKKFIGYGAAEKLYKISKLFRG